MSEPARENASALRSQTICSLWFVSGFFIALCVVMIVNSIGGNREEFRDQSEIEKFPLINPLLFCERGDGIENSTYSSFRFKLEDQVNRLMTKKDGSHVSVYFRDLNNGPWFGINESETFFPSSLLKLPLLISVLKEKETDPAFLSKVIEYDGINTEITQHFPPKEHIEVGKKYTVGELVERSILYSENESALLIFQLLGEKKVQAVYHDLGLIPPDVNGDATMNVKEYGTFFRVLFNSSYVGREESEAALELLANTEFDKALRAGVPDFVLVSHKFGERIISDKLVQLHDCGIVYVPQKPYLLCVMTHGKDFETLTNIIKDISKIVYEGVVNEGL